MRIRELRLKHFGKFTDKTIGFADGINLIYGENESGKSTIHTFIKSMFFGMERARGRAAAKDTYHQYEPWENPNYYSGTMKFICGNRNFILQRNFDKYSKSVSLHCEDDGEELSVENGDLDMLLGGMQEPDYENTVAVGQLKAAPDRTLAEEMKNYAANFYASGNEDIDFARAVDFLKKRKKEVEAEKREAERKRQAEREKAEMESAYIWRELRRLEQEIDEENAIWAAESRKWSEWRKEEREDEDTEIRQWRIHPVEIITMILTLILPFLLFKRPWSLLVVIVVALAESLYVWNCLKDDKKKKKKNIREHDKSGRDLSENLNKIKWKLDKLKEDHQEKTVQYHNHQELLSELDEVSLEYREQDRRLKTIDMAMERLIRLSGELQEGLSDKLNNRVSQILCSITGGKYTKVKVDEDLQIFLLSDGKRINMDQVSRGTIEQIYFALRMAAVEMLFEDEYPVILDDTFVYYDEARLGETLKWLNENKRQVLLFTCQKREEEILRKLGLEYNSIYV